MEASSGLVQRCSSSQRHLKLEEEKTTGANGFFPSPRQPAAAGRRLPGGVCVCVCESVCKDQDSTQLASFKYEEEAEEL